MSKVTVDSDDLLTLVKHCVESELDGKACRGAMNTIRLNPAVPPKFALVYGELYRSERTNSERSVTLRYAPIVQAIADGVHVDAALRQVAGQMRR